MDYDIATHEKKIITAYQKRCLWGTRGVRDPELYSSHEMHVVPFADRGSSHLRARKGRNTPGTVATVETRRKLLWKNIGDVISADDDMAGILFVQWGCVVGGRGCG